MVIISHKAIREFALNHPELLSALERWYKITMDADWQGFNDIKRQFNSVDAIGNGLFVFNIKGSDCRLIARIIFKTRTVYIRFIGTHNQYDLLDISKL
ncbi:MAG: type II toxin-antitoxin system HigB family toxin [Chitinophagaceae bacterium]